jgi:U3 small nucleolar RNA-associated protein 3
LPSGRREMMKNVRHLNREGCSKLNFIDAKLGTNEVEVLGLPDSDISEEESEVEEEDEEDNEEDYSDDELQQLSKAAAAAKAHAARIRVDKHDDDDNEIDGWGSTKKEYYGADQLETEQAALDEEAEAKRIQAQNLEDMNDADYGLDQDWIMEDPTKESANGVSKLQNVTEALPELVIPDGASDSDLLKIMKGRYPEFAALSKELVELQPEHERLRDLVVIQQTSNPRVICKYWALGTYLSSLAMYFALLTETSKAKASNLAKSPSELRDHTVMKTLVSFKISWEKIKDVSEGVPESDQESDSEVENHLNGTTNGIEPVPVKSSKKKSKSSKASKKSASSALRAARSAAVEADLALFTASLAPSTSTKRVKSARTPIQATNGNDSDFGDETELTAHEAVEKAKRRRNLRFYTSQIAQKTQKRGAASRDAGGDVDIPHRERWRDKQIRLAAEAQAKKEQMAAHGRGANHGDQRVKASKKDLESDNYEDLVAKTASLKAKKKEERRDQFESAAAADRAYEDEGVEGDGKRGLSYQILKNKGLTQFKRKNLRNPRVKKRMKYEDSMKKLGSMKAIYKGTPKKGYQGELTGIKTNLVKSVKL